MPWFLYLTMQGSLAKGWNARDGGASGTWKVSNCMEGVTRFLRDCVAEKGRSGILLDGIKCTLGVFPRTMSW